jgi:hypothetical protein
MKASDPDHKELIQIGLKNGEEIQSFAKRNIRRSSVFQYALIKGQPAQFPVDKTIHDVLPFLFSCIPAGKKDSV